MATFRITPHGRLQEWVADEKGYFRDEGLDYEFVYGTAAVKTRCARAWRLPTAIP
jgi:hypothetical protein